MRERERERIEFFIYDRLMLEVKSMKHALFKYRLPSYAPNSIFHKVGSKLYNIGRKCISSFNSVHFYLTGTKLNKKKYILKVSVSRVLVSYKPISHLMPIKLLSANNIFSRTSVYECL